MSAVPSLSIAECSPPIPLAWRPWVLAISFSFFSSAPAFVILGNLPRIDCLFPVPMLVGHVVITPYFGCSANSSPLFSILVKSSWREWSTAPKSFPCIIEIILSWSSSPTQIIFVLSSLNQIPLPWGQSEATPDEVKWLSVVMSLKRKWFFLMFSASDSETWFLCPGVKL